MVPIMTLCVSRFTPALSPTHRQNPAMLATSRMRPKTNDPKQGFNPPCGGDHEGHPPAVDDLHYVAGEEGNFETGEEREVPSESGEAWTSQMSMSRRVRYHFSELEATGR